MAEWGICCIALFTKISIKNTVSTSSIETVVSTQGIWGITIRSSEVTLFCARCLVDMIVSTDRKLTGRCTGSTCIPTIGRTCVTGFTCECTHYTITTDSLSLTAHTGYPWSSITSRSITDFISVTRTIATDTWDKTCTGSITSSDSSTITCSCIADFTIIEYAITTYWYLGTSKASTISTVTSSSSKTCRTVTVFLTDPSGTGSITSITIGICRSSWITYFSCFYGTISTYWRWRTYSTVTWTGSTIFCSITYIISTYRRHRAYSTVTWTGSTVFCSITHSVRTYWCWGWRWRWTWYFKRWSTFCIGIATRVYTRSLLKCRWYWLCSFGTYGT